MKRFLTKLHRWLGFPVGLLFLVTFGTGFLTAIDEIMSRNGGLDLPYFEQSAVDQGNMLEHLLASHPDASQIQLPTPQSPYYQVRLRGETFIYALGSIEPTKHIQQSREGFFATVLQLHRNLLLGREGLGRIKGAHIVAWVALLSLALSLLGLYLWWPLRRSFKTRDILPRSLKRKTLYYSHMTSGVVVLMAIIPLAITGAGITYRDVAKKVLGVAEAAPSSLQPAIPVPDHWPAWLAAAQAEVPGGQLQALRLPRKRPPADRPAAETSDTRAQPGNTVSLKDVAQTRPPAARKPENDTTVQLVYQAPGDWWSLANSRVSIDTKTSTIVKVTLFENLSLGNKLYAAMVPLHTGRNLPVAYVGILAVFSAVGTLMVASGLISFLRKKRRYPVLKAPLARYRKVLGNL